MKKLFLFLILSFFSAQGLAASCPDGSEPVKSLSADGTYFVYKCVEASSLFDGRYRFTLYRHNENDGDEKIKFRPFSMILGAGDIEIKNGEMIIETENSYLTTGPKDLYDTFEGQINEKGNVSGSVELAILFGKDHSEVYNLNGQIDEQIWGESPDADYFKVYLTLREK